MFKYNNLMIDWLGHSTVGIYGEITIYIDPYTGVLKGGERKADLIISTHNHKDHFDINAINQLSEPKTNVVVKSGCDIKDLISEYIKEIEIDQTVTVDGIEIMAVAAYNVTKFKSPGVPFHPEGFGMGIVFNVERTKIYYAGDTDCIEPMKKLKDQQIDIAFLPIGGKYCMDVEEATRAVINIEPKIAIPVHYNHIKGTEADPMIFKQESEKNGLTKVFLP